MLNKATRYQRKRCIHYDIERCVLYVYRISTLLKVTSYTGENVAVYFNLINHFIPKNSVGSVLNITVGYLLAFILCKPFLGVKETRRTEQTKLMKKDVNKKEYN